ERIQPNTVTYSCVVKACGRAQELDRAFMFLRDMQEQRIAQNIMTWAPVIEAVCKHRDDAAVQDGLQRMLRAGVAPQGRAQQQLEERLGPLNLALACAEPPKERPRGRHQRVRSAEPQCRSNSGRHQAAATTARCPELVSQATRAH
ncbi:unnamed protein product, partial [Symbiodinium necroappetens]